MLDMGSLGGRREEIDHLHDDLAEVRGLQLEFLDAGKPQEIVGHADEAFAFLLEFLHPAQGPAFALILRLLKVLGQELQIEAERAQVILDLMDEAAGKLGQGGVGIVGHDGNCTQCPA